MTSFDELGLTLRGVLQGILRETAKLLEVVPPRVFSYLVIATSVLSVGATLAPAAAKVGLTAALIVTVPAALILLVAVIGLIRSVQSPAQAR